MSAASTYYLSIHVGEPFVALEQSTTWVLFVMTLVLVGVTFWALEYCSNVFGNLMVLSSIDGRTGVANEAPLIPIQPVAVQTTQPGLTSMCSSSSQSNRGYPIRMAAQPKMNYQHFHNTLDVSVFR